MFFSRFFFFLIFSSFNSWYSQLNYIDTGNDMSLCTCNGMTVNPASSSSSFGVYKSDMRVIYLINWKKIRWFDEFNDFGNYLLLVSMSLNIRTMLRCKLWRLSLSFFVCIDICNVGNRFTALELLSFTSGNSFLVKPIVKWFLLSVFLLSVIFWTVFLTVFRILFVNENKFKWF